MGKHMAGGTDEKGKWVSWGKSEYSMDRSKREKIVRKGLLCTVYHWPVNELLVAGVDGSETHRHQVGQDARVRALACWTVHAARHTSTHSLQWSNVTMFTHSILPQAGIAILGYFDRPIGLYTLWKIYFKIITHVSYYMSILLPIKVIFKLWVRIAGLFIVFDHRRLGRK